MSANESVREAVLRSLLAVSSDRDARFFADRFSKHKLGQFALLVIDPRCLKKPLLEALSSNLKILADLGLSPILFVGALQKDKQSVPAQAQRLCRILDLAKIRSSRLNCASYQLIPEMRRKIRAGHIVVLEQTDLLGSLGLAKIVEEMRPAKVIFLQPSGGLRRKGQRVSVLNIDKPVNQPPKTSMSAGQLRALELAKHLIETAGYKFICVIVSPLNILTELFTVNGAGTLIRKGAQIRSLKRLPPAERKQVRASIENAFGRSLVRDFEKKKRTRVFLEKNFRGGALMSELSGLAYLDKFWVGKQAQGEGISRDIWECLTEEIPAFFWRSRTENPFNDWYMKVCDGMQSSGGWRVFWIGLKPSEIPQAVVAAVNAPQDFLD